MKKLFALAIAAAFSHAAFAAPSAPSAPSQPAQKEKACYKQVPVEEENSSYNDTFTVGANAGGFAFVRVPCATEQPKK